MATPKDFIGPSVWKNLHYFASSYNPEQASAFKMFVQSLTVLFPCPMCADNLKQKLKEIPIDNYLKNRDDLFFWTYLIHDVVNKQISAEMVKINPRKRPKISPPFDKIKAYYFGRQYRLNRARPVVQKAVQRPVVRKAVQRPVVRKAVQRPVTRTRRAAAAAVNPRGVVAKRSTTRKAGCKKCGQRR